MYGRQPPQGLLLDNFGDGRGGSINNSYQANNTSLWKN
jgi:hypothetical protein